MKNKEVTALIIIMILLLFPMVLSDCERQQDPSQLVSSTAGPTEAPNNEPSSQPESETKATQEPEPTEAPDSMVNFEEVFAENPIDSQLADALDTASSSSAILKAYETAGKYWRALVPIAYNAAKSAAAEEDQAQLEQDHKAWEDTIDDVITAIQEENIEGADGKITAARLIEEKYRETAKELCKIVYAGTGELPDFAPAMSDEPKG